MDKRNIMFQRLGIAVCTLVLLAAVIFAAAPPRWASPVERPKNWAPEGYQLVLDRTEASGTTLFVYSSKAGDLLSVKTMPPEGELTVDTEDAEIQEVAVNEYPAILIIKDGFRVLWTDTARSLVYDVYAQSLDSDSFWEVVHQIAS